jgi:hypothetical protein
MTAFGRRTNENISPSGRQAMPTPPNIYEINRVVNRRQARTLQKETSMTARSSLILEE